MSMSLNRAQLIGNLTRDPESRQTPSGKSVVNFGIATNHKWSDANGQQQEKTEFHNIVIWGKLAEIAAQYLRKGSKVFIEGRMQTREWEGQDGVKRYRTEIVADNLIMLGSRGEPMSAPSMDREPAGIQDEEPMDEVPTVSDEVDQKEEIAVEDLPF